jgi:hypothetical protein
MDCAICLEAITKQTGVVTLSCVHNFHFRCIDEWFYKQLVEGNHQTCPCCRSEGTDLDRCAYEEVEANDDDDETYEDDEDDISESNSLADFAERLSEGSLRLERNASGQWVVTNVEDLVYDSVRSLFGPLNTLDLEVESPQEIAARKIQAFFRGNEARNTHRAAVALMRLFQQAYNL